MGFYRGHRADDPDQPNPVGRSVLRVTVHDSWDEAEVTQALCDTPVRCTIYTHYMYGVSDRETAEQVAEAHIMADQQSKVSVWAREAWQQASSLQSVLIEGHPNPLANGIFEQPHRGRHKFPFFQNAAGFQLEFQCRGRIQSNWVLRMPMGSFQGDYAICARPNVHPGGDRQDCPSKLPTGITDWWVWIGNKQTHPGVPQGCGWGTVRRH